MQGNKNRISAWIQHLSRLSIFIFSLFLTVALGNTVYHTWKKRDFLRARETQLASEIAKNERLAREFTQSQTSEFVERIARDELGLVKPGETVVIIGSPPASPVDGQVNSDTSSTSPNSVSTLPLWRQWWELFF